MQRRFGASQHRSRTGVTLLRQADRSKLEQQLWRSRSSARLKWSGKAARDVGVVLRDYRNYIHPEKERSHGITPSAAAMSWGIVTALAGAIVESAKKA